MGNIGALGSYALAIQEMQMNLIKMQIDTQQKAVEVLLENSQNVPVSATNGHNIDISV